MGEEVRVWYDEEGDYLEVLLEHKEGYFRETDNDAVMEKVDEARRFRSSVWGRRRAGS